MASTGDTILMSMIFTFMYDIYGYFKKIDYTKVTGKEEQYLVSRAKYFTEILGLSALLVIFIGRSVATLYDLIVASFSIQIVLFWPILLALFSKKDLRSRPRLAATGIGAGVLAAVIMIVLYLIPGWSNPNYLNSAPLAAFVATLIFYSILWFKAPKQQSVKPHGTSTSN
jgi:Na+/proline symporter